MYGRAVAAKSCEERDVLRLPCDICGPACIFSHPERPSNVGLTSPVRTKSMKKQQRVVNLGHPAPTEHAARHAMHELWSAQFHRSSMIILLKATELWVERGLERFGRAIGPDFAPSEIEDALLV